MIYTAAQAAERLGLSVYTVYLAIRTGRLRARRYAVTGRGRGTLRITEQSLEEFEAQAEHRAVERAGVVDASQEQCKEWGLG